MTPARIQLIGEVAAISADGTVVPVRGAQPRCALALLVLASGSMVRREAFGGQFWGDALPDHWSGAVRGVIAKVRSVLAEIGAEAALETTGDGWRLRLDAFEVDLFEAEHLVTAAETTLTSDAEHAARAAEAASRLLSGELAPGAAGPTIDDHQETVELLRRRAALVHAQALMSMGRYAAAVEPARELLARRPYDESALVLASRAMALTGDRHGAIELIEEFQERLAADLDVELGSDARAVLVALRRGAPNDLGVPIPSPDELPMVGRHHELELFTGWTRARTSAGGGQLVVISGEPGSGKTRLASEVARRWIRSDQPVVWVSCVPVQSDSFGATTELVRQVLAKVPGVLDSLGPQRGVISRFLDGIEPAAPPLASDPADRARLVRAVSSMLAAAVTVPTLIVIDDLQWIDADSLDLFTALVDQLSTAPVLLVVTTRGHPAPVAQFLEHATRRMTGARIELGGLDSAAVVDLLRAAGLAKPDTLADAVLRRTGGNPFFISQLLADRTGGDGFEPERFPQSLQTWFEQRISSLPEDLRLVLDAAAVIGLRVDTATLAHTTGQSELELARIGDRLVAQHLLADDRGYRFPHALTRDAVLHQMSPTLTAALHARAADARPEPALRAYHLLRAGDARVTDALHAALHAADDALVHAAWTEAADWCEEILALDPTEDLRAQALIRKGHALRGRNDRPGARSCFDAALSLNHVDASTVALATLGLVGGGARGVAEDLGDLERAQLLEVALGGLEDDDDDLRVRLELELALALLLTDQVARRETLTRDAVGRARRLDRPEVLARALLGSRVVQLDPDQAEQRLAICDEVLSLRQRGWPPDIGIQALMARHEDLLLTGRRDESLEALAAASADAAVYDHPYWQWVVATWGVLGLIIDGRLDEAEAAAFGALAYQPDHPEAAACLGVNLVDLRLFQGRASEVVPLLAEAADEHPNIPCYRAVLALCCTEAGDLGAATSAYRHFADHDFANLPRDTNWLLGIGVLADVAAALDDIQGAQRLVPFLEPHRQRHIILNCYGGGGSYWGPVALQLAQLLATCGEMDNAAEHFDIASEMAAGFGATLMLERIERARRRHGADR